MRRDFAQVSDERAPVQPLVERCLRDGTRHQLIKVVRGPADITRQLTQLGWQAAITPTGDWLVGQAWPTPMPQPGHGHTARCHPAPELR
jgi:hypothetical protein